MSKKEDTKDKTETKETEKEKEFVSVNGTKKFYIKNDKIKQVEKDGKIVDDATGIECSYYENLTDDEATLRRDNGEII